jgi:flagellar hook-basal body complex protein FliE
MSIGGAGFKDKLFATLRDMQGEAGKMQQSIQKPGEQREGPSFMDQLQQGVGEVNAMSVKSDKMAMELATGKSGNIHETMLAATQAELAFNLMVQVRNKALEAYSEVMRMPV